MGILVVAVLATLLGFALIFLIGRGQPVSPAAPENLGRGDATDTAWVRRYGVEGLQRLLVTLFTEMGFHPERSERSAASVDLFANDPTPIKGGRIYVHGVLGLDGPVEGDEVRNLIDTARAEYVGKGILVTLGRFSTDARDTAKGNPVDLLDGDDLARLMRKHLPQAFATRKV
ncbi:MAG TPA: restriction endonuclease [Myxococcales bacterium]|nr:restriction endonuclease [Myxococcales bacterium]